MSHRRTGLRIRMFERSPFRFLRHHWSYSTSDFSVRQNTNRVRPVAPRHRLDTLAKTVLAAIVIIPVFFSAVVFAQEPAKTPAPAPAQEPAKADDPNASKSVGDLTAKYRFQERFTSKSGLVPPNMIGQYQVAFRETFTLPDAVEKENRSRVIQAIFSERPAIVNPGDERIVTDSIRHYSKIGITPDPWKGRLDRRPLDDLTIWYRQVAGDVPLVMVLSPGRNLRDEEYRFAINYAFVMELAYALPDSPVRIGDKWTVNSTGAIALVNDEIRQGNLTGKLVEIHAHPTDPKLQVAVLNISGRVVTALGQDIFDNAINARLEFVFPAGAKENGIVDASGAIEKVLLAQVGELRVPNGIRARTKKRDLNFEMKRPGADPVLTIPSPTPKSTPDNSWLTYSDQKNRFHIRHPQEFEPRPVPNPNMLRLMHLRADGGDAVDVEYIEKPTDRPEVLFKKLIEDWRKTIQGIDIQLGISEKLPAVEWPDMTVSHMEAALNYADPQGRPVHRLFDAYFLQFPQNVNLQVSATSFQEQPEAFRAQVVSMLKTAKLGPPKKD